MYAFVSEKMLHAAFYIIIYDDKLNYDSQFIGFDHYNIEFLYHNNNNGLKIIMFLDGKREII